MIVFVKIETEGRCEECGRFGPVELSRLLCHWCFAHWIEYCKWLVRQRPFQLPSTLALENFWSDGVTLYDSAAPRPS